MECFRSTAAKELLTTKTAPISAPKPLKKRYFEAAAAASNDKQQPTELPKVNSNQHKDINTSSNQQQTLKQQYSSANCISLPPNQGQNSPFQQSNISNNGSSPVNSHTFNNVFNQPQLPTVRPVPVNVVGNKVKRKAVAQNNDNASTKQANAQSDLRLNQLMLDPDLLGKFVEDAFSSDEQSTSDNSANSSPSLKLGEDRYQKSQDFIKPQVTNSVQHSTYPSSTAPTKRVLPPYDLIHLQPTSSNSLLVACQQPSMTLPVNESNMPTHASPLTASQLAHNQAHSSALSYMGQSNHMWSIHQSSRQATTEHQLPFNMDMVSMAILQQDTNDSNDSNQSSNKIQIRRRSLSTSALNAPSNPDEPVDFSISKTYEQTNQNIIDKVINKLLAKDNPQIMLLA